MILTPILYFLTAALAVRVARIRWAMGIVLVLLPLAFTGKALLTGRVYAPIDLPYGAQPMSDLRDEYGINEKSHNALLSDVYSHNIPWKFAVRDAYRRGEAPLWNPGLFAGDVLAAAAQPAAYDPLLLLSFLLPIANSLTFLATLTFFIAGIGMFLLLRDLGVGGIPSLAGAAAWMFSLFNAFWIEWSLGATTVWLPLLILGVRRVVREQSLKAAGLLTFAFVMMLLAGHPESALHLVAIGMVWAAAELWAVRGRGFIRASLLGVGAGAAALLLCAIYVLPVVDALPQTYEHSLRKWFFSQLDKSVPFPVALRRLEAQLVPFIGGLPHREWPAEAQPFDAPLESAYCGSAALALAAFGAWRSRARVKWLALALIVAGLLLGAEMAPFADILGALPLFDISLNERFAVMAAFGIALLAALGMEDVRRRDAARSAGEDAGVPRAGRTLALTAVLVAIVLALACANAWDRMQARGFSDAFLRRETALLIAGPLVVALIAATARGRAVLALLALAIVAQRTLEAGDIYPTLPARAFYPTIPILEHLPKTGEPYRIVGQHMTLIPNTATLYGLEDVRGYQALRLHRWVDTIEMWSVPQGVWWNRVDDLTRPFLSLLNVRYALAPSNVPVTPGWRQIAETPGTRLLENPRALGRAFVPRNVRLGYPAEVTLLQMKIEEDFGERSWIDSRTGPQREEVNGPGRVRTERKGRNELLLHASMDGGGWVVVTQTAWNGWRAYLDGKRAPIRYANHAFLGVYVPQGEHTVRLVYRPRAFVLGAWVSGISALLLLTASAAAFFRARSGSTDRSAATDTR